MDGIFNPYVMLIGMYCYAIQLEHGLSVTGMTDRVSWGLYISNFTFLVGVAAAAVMLVMPTYVLKDIDFKQAVLIGEGLGSSRFNYVFGFCNCRHGRTFGIMAYVTWNRSI